MIRTTRWRPDTCGCDIEYQWDDALPEAERVHTACKVNRACPAHASLGISELYAALKEENTTKNMAVAVLVNSYAVDPGGVLFYFDAARKLEIMAQGLTYEQVSSALADMVAAGKVTVRTV